jgi:hypothetical protein
MISSIDVMIFGRNRISVIDGMISDRDGMIFSRDGMNLAGME